MKLRKILAGLWIILLLLAGTCYAENSDNPIVARTEYGYLRLNIPSVKKIEYYGRFYIACTYTGHTEYFVYGVPVVEEYGTYNCWFDPSKDKVLEFGKSFRDASSVWISVNHYSKDISKNNLSIYSYIRNNFPKLCNEVITDNKIADEKYGSYIEKAFEAHENKDWEKEYTYLKNAYDNGCQSQAILHDLAEACWNLGDYDNAIEWASKRIDLTNSAFAYKTRAYYYYLLEKNDLALEDAKWATMKVKDNPGIIDTRGMIYTALGQYDKALADFNAVLKINDKYASAYYHRGKCYEALGKKDNAQSDFKKAKKYDPEITDDKADFAKQRSQNQALKQQRQYQKREKYKEDLKKLNDAVYVHNNAQNFPAKVVFENDDIIITVTGNIKNNESEQFYQEVIPLEVRTNYESGTYQQHYNQMKAQVEAEQAAQQEQRCAAARASGYNLGVPVSINVDFNNLQWSNELYYDKGEPGRCEWKCREAKIGEHLYLIKAEHSVQGRKAIEYFLRSTDGKIYAISYDYTYEEKNIKNYVKYDSPMLGRQEMLVECDQPAFDNVKTIPEGTVGGRKKHFGAVVVADNIKRGNFWDEAKQYGVASHIGMWATSLGFEVNREPDISLNQVYDLTDVYDRSGGFDEEACRTAYEYAFTDFWDKAINHPLDINREYWYVEYFINNRGYPTSGGREIRISSHQNPAPDHQKEDFIRSNAYEMVLILD